jgi:Rieske Fe-S protein
MSEPLITRRSVIRGAVVTITGGVAGYLVAANSSVAKEKNGTTNANAYGPSGSGGEHLLAPAAQIPAGGGIVLASAKVVLSRSSNGAIHAFSAVCTHQGCIVGSVQNGEIICPCHGSRFNAFTGAVINGPAALPLPPVSVIVQNGSVYTG